MLKKALLILLAIIVVVIAGAFIKIQMTWDKVYDIPYPDLKTSTDSAIIAHGKYLVEGPAHCTGCHVSSFDDLVRIANGESVPLQGGVTFTMGPLGTMYPPNLTPDTETGIGRYEDGEIFRMMRHAVKPNGRASLSVLMPFWNMADDDMVAVVSYLKSMEPVRHEVPGPEWTFMGKFVRTVAPTFKPVTDIVAPEKAPAMAPTVKRGKYLAHFVANCVGCHTQRDMETFEAVDVEFAGGMEFEPFTELHRILGVSEDLWCRSPNITPHPDSYLSKFKNVDEWKTRFRKGRIISYSPMDWDAFAQMTDEDLEALWLYLHSLDPVEKDNDPVTYKVAME